MSKHLDKLAVITQREVRDIERALRHTDTMIGKAKVRKVLNRLNETFAAYEPKKVAQADMQYGRDGEIEIDEGAVCSRGEDPGCYVQAWVWVYDR